MQLLLINPPSPQKRQIIRAIDCSHEAKADYLWQPNDFMIITSLLEEKDTVCLVDATADSLSENDYFKELEKAKSDLCIFALSSVCWESDLSYFREIRKRFPNTPTFVFGDIFLEREYQELILGECDGIVCIPYTLDLTAMRSIRESHNNTPLPGVCRTTGEEVFSASGKYQMAEKSGFPRHELFMKKGYCFPVAKQLKFATVTTMWGCPFTCSYCSSSKMQPFVRKYETIIEELDYLSKLGVKELFFADKAFGFPKKNIMPLLEIMAKKYSFSWSCYFHPQHFEKDLFELMNQAGCHTIIIGIDSADLPSLKQYQRVVQSEKLNQLLKQANEYNWNICADFILGLPHENEKDIINTLNYGVSLPIDFASFNIAAPLPGSGIRKKAKEKGKLLFGKEGYDTFGHEIVLETDHIHAKRLLELRKRAIIKFYLRPSSLLRRIRRISSFEHFWIQLRQMYAILTK